MRGVIFAEAKLMRHHPMTFSKIFHTKKFVEQVGDGSCYETKHGNEEWPRYTLWAT
jgi:hypothetical protein